MMEDKLIDICVEAVEKYGQEAQIWMAIEETAELCNALAKYKRNRVDNDDVCEEIADVVIMCIQLAYIFDIDRVGEYLKKKLTRLENKLHDTNSETNMAGEV